MSDTLAIKLSPFFSMRDMLKSEKRVDVVTTAAPAATTKRAPPSFTKVLRVGGHGQRIHEDAAVLGQPDGNEGKEG